MTRPRPLLVPASCALVVCALVLAACGRSKPAPVDVSRFIDNERVERAIELKVRQQRGRRVFVSCPALILIRVGGRFSCTAATPGGRTAATFTVVMRDTKGRVRFMTANAGG